MENTQKNNSLAIRGALLVSLSGLLYGFMGFFGTQLIKVNLTITAMLFWRFLVATLWVLFSAKWQNKNFFANMPSYSTLFKLMLIGGLSYSSASAFFFLASQYTGTGIAMVIFFCAPVFVTLFVWATTHWRMNIYAASSLIAIIFGLIMLKGHGNHELSLIGIFFAMLSGVGYATYIITSKQNTQQLDSNLLTFLVCLSNTFIFFIIAYTTQSLYIPTTFYAWFYIIALGIIATAVPVQLLLDGIKHISSIKASILSVLEPVVTLLIGVALLNESVSIVQAIGIIVVLLGAILIQFEPHQVH